jgi:hypothetical protein
MAKPILHKSPLKRLRKNNPKPKKPTPAPAAKRDKKPEAPFIPISMEELFALHDVADALKLLRDIAQEAPEMQLIQTELLIKKTSRCAWNLIHETLDSRWADRNPDADLIRKD